MEDKCDKYEAALFQLWDETYSTVNKREFIRINTASEQQSSVGRWLKKAPYAVIMVLCVHKEQK
jgi:hypothetical protein